VDRQSLARTTKDESLASQGFVAEVFLKVESGVKHLAHRYDRADIKGALQKQCNPSKGENLAAHEAPAYRS
jgi:hypothetical protein